MLNFIIVERGLVETFGALPNSEYIIGNSLTEKK